MRKLPHSKSSKAKLKVKRESESAAGQQSKAAAVPEVVSKESVSRIPQLIGKTFNYLGDSISSGLSYLQRMSLSLVEGASGPLAAIATFASFRRTISMMDQTSLTFRSDGIKTHADRETPGVFLIELISRMLCIQSRVLRAQSKYNLNLMTYGDLSWVPSRFPSMDSSRASHLSICVLGHVRRLTNHAWDTQFLSVAETDAALSTNSLDEKSSLFLTNLFSLMSILPDSQHSAWTQKYVQNIFTGFEYLRDNEGYYWLCEFNSTCFDRFGAEFWGNITVHTYVNIDGGLAARAITVHQLPGATPNHHTNHQLPYPEQAPSAVKHTETENTSIHPYEVTTASYTREKPITQHVSNKRPHTQHCPSEWQSPQPNTHFDRKRKTVPSMEDSLDIWNMLQTGQSPFDSFCERLTSGDDGEMLMQEFQSLNDNH